MKTIKTSRKYNNIVLYLLSTYKVVTDTERDGIDTEKDKEISRFNDPWPR